ncbi:MAG: hypothetical protein A3K77_05010 [Euryarchaeota archaeon RBG_13_31_8]|nr:MAG: hypothetical protein A3K77_05010 [Euryarchaeota archaeon RBG_13_31_8]
MSFLLIPYISFAPTAAEFNILSISFLVKYAFFGLPVVPDVVKTLINISGGTVKKSSGLLAKSFDGV